jgi:hypothetical protein
MRKNSAYSQSLAMGDATVAPQQDDRPLQFLPINHSGTDRLHRLRVLLEATTQEMVAARRQAARLRVENRRLARQIAQRQVCMALDGATPSLAQAQGR